VSYSTLSAVSIGFALLAVAVAIVVAVLVRARGMPAARSAWRLMLVVLAGAAVCAFVASAGADNDLHGQTRRLLSLTVSAEHMARVRSGRYVTSVAALQRLSPALRDEINHYSAVVHVSPGAAPNTVTVHVSVGFGTFAQKTLGPA
jgi:hypothetical protein